MQIKKRLIFITMVVIIVAALAYGFRPMPVSVDTAEVVRAPLRVVIEEEGQTRVIERYEITAPITGYLNRIKLDVGDRITQGQLLFSIQPLRAEMLDPRRRAEALALVAARESALRVAKENAAAAAASADLAKSELDRIARLVKAKHATEDEADRARAEVRRSEAALRAAKFSVDVTQNELEMAKSALRYSAAEEPEITEKVTVLSPIEGTVLKRLRESEGVVEAGQALLEVADPKSLEVIVDVLSIDAVKIARGTPVEIKRWGGNEIIHGVVKRVESMGFTKISALGVEEQRVWVVVEIVSPYEVWQRLGDGYRVEAGFVIWEQENVLQIPSSALFRYRQDWAVFVKQDGIAKRQIVGVGMRNGLVAEITSGLTAGQQVITHPSDDVEDGVRIRLR